MTDRKEEYYQPWLRDPAPHDAARAQGDGLAKPGEDPPVGIDLARYAAEPARKRAPRLRPAQLKAGTAALWMHVRDGAGAFADWTIRAGERADIPARIAAMDIPHRSRAIARHGGALAAGTARTIGRGSGRAARALAETSGNAWQKLALGDKVARISSGAGRGIGQVARAGKDGIGEATAKLRPAPRAEPAPPASGLEQLLAREEQDAPAQAAQAAPAATDLPLFASEPDVELAPAPPAKAAPAATIAPPPARSVPEGDERSPHPVPRAAAAISPRRTSHGAAALPVPLWAFAAGGLLLLTAAFWLGGRFGGGMSKSDVETVVAEYIRANPQIIPDALEAQRDREIAKAIDAIRPALEKPYAGAWAGHADGDVTMVVFTDYACGFCRASVPDIDRLVREDKRLKVVFRELPIIAPQSRDAALMALAAARQGKYDAFHHAMFAAGSLSPAAIAAAAEKAGVVTDGSADVTANEALFQRELDSNLAIATQLQLNATPTWVIGNQLLQGQVGHDALKRAIAAARAES